jgi:hypothetical protein
MNELAGKSSIAEIEKFANRKFVYAAHISALMDQAAKRHMESTFEDVLFFAKFLVNAYTVLSRTGIDSQETEKLSTEFKENFEKISTLLKTIMKEAPQPSKTEFISTFFDSTTQSVDRLMTLLRELAWVKNYRLDLGLRAEKHL